MSKARATAPATDLAASFELPAWLALDRGGLIKGLGASGAPYISVCWLPGEQPRTGQLMAVCRWEDWQYAAELFCGDWTKIDGRNQQALSAARNVGQAAAHARAEIKSTICSRALTDDGQPIRRARGEVVVEEVTQRISAHRSVVVKLARVYDPIVALLARGSITRAEADAAEYYRDDLAISEGYRPSKPMERVDGGGGGQTPSDVLLDALARVRWAERAVGREALGVFLHAVVAQGSLSSWCARERRDARTATRLLAGALGRLAVFYEARGVRE